MAAPLRRSHVDKAAQPKREAELSASDHRRTALPNSCGERERALGDVCTAGDD